MIEKGKLSRHINDIIEAKKRLIPLLNRHVSSSLLFSGLKGSDRDAIVEKFQGIVITQAKHIEILNGVKDEIEKGKKDVY